MPISSAITALLATGTIAAKIENGRQKVNEADVNPHSDFSE
jgi:hypothetical protein